MFKMNNLNSENQINQAQSSQLKAAKQPSILENEIGQLKTEVAKINRLTNSIAETIGPPPICNPPYDKNPVDTVANSLRDIRFVAEESRAQLENIEKCLEEHLGSLKLDG